jgi:hypothetical protein
MPKLQATSVTVDYGTTHPLVYVYYVDPDAMTASKRKVMPNVLRGDTVVADVDEHGALLGIELLDMAPETVAIARRLAEEYGAEFPAHLTAVPA